MPNMKEQMEKRVDLISRLDNLKTENPENDKLIDALISYIIDRECQMMQLEEAMQELDNIIKSIRESRKEVN